MDPKPVHYKPTRVSDLLCKLAGLNPNAEGAATSRAAVEIECPCCRVAADLMQESGDLLLNEEGRWKLDDRPEEYRSVYRFIDYLTEDERKTFTVEELQELVRQTKRPYRETLLELVRLGYRVERPAPEREVRGIGRLKPARAADR